MTGLLLEGGRRPVTTGTLRRVAGTPRRNRPLCLEPWPHEDLAHPQTREGGRHEDRGVLFGHAGINVRVRLAARTSAQTSSFE